MGGNASFFVGFLAAAVGVTAPAARLRAGSGKAPSSSAVVVVVVVEEDAAAAGGVWRRRGASSPSGAGGGGVGTTIFPVTRNRASGLVKW